MTRLTEIEGIGENFARKLQNAGIQSTQALLDKGCSTKGRRELAQNTGISESMLLRWINCADLFRIKGVGEEYADLLEAAGVDTVPELAQRNADNLAAKMAEVNETKTPVRQVPSAASVTKWVDEAKELGRKITY